MVETLTSAASTDARGEGAPGLARLGARLRSRRGAGGFTLLETIIVIVIVAVISAMVIPSIRSGTQQAAVRRSVRAFISAARQASAIAVSRRKPTALIVWPSEGAFGVEGSETRHELPEFAEFGEIVGGIEAEADDEIRFEFFPTGSSAGGSVEIAFERGYGTLSWNLILDPLVSRVRVEEAS